MGSIVLSHESVVEAVKEYTLRAMPNLKEEDIVSVNLTLGDNDVIGGSIETRE